VIRILRNLLLLTVFAMFAVPAIAQADPVSDCNGDGDLDKRYSNSELRKALDNLDSGVDEYTSCREILKGAIASGSDKRNNASDDGSRGGGGATGGGGGGDDGGAISPEEQQARAKDNAELDAMTSDENAKPEVNVGGEQLEPGSNGLFDLASASNDVPLPLLLALIAIGLLALTGGLVALRDRVPALARIPLVSKIPRVSLPRLRR
jgi:hypothetical protein